jgi:hypothetical protein
MPAATQEGLLNALTALKEDGRTELTLLVLGKGGVGKSRCVAGDPERLGRNIMA